MIETLRLLSRRPVALIGLGGVIFFVLLAYVAPLVVSLQDAPDVTSVYLSPSLAHPLGTDYQGRDVLNQIVHGGADNFANIPTRYVPEPDAMTFATGDSGARIACGIIQGSG